MVQAEQSVIGCLMMAPELLDKARAVLSPAMFEAQPLARIFSCMLELKKAGTPVDAVTVVSRLGDGYEAVIRECACIAPRIGTFPQYAAIVLDAWRERTLVTELQSLAISGRTADEMTAELERMAARQRSIMQKVHSASEQTFGEAVAQAYRDLLKPDTSLKTDWKHFNDVLGGLQRSACTSLPRGDGKTVCPASVPCSLQALPRGLQKPGNDEGLVHRVCRGYDDPPAFRTTTWTKTRRSARHCGAARGDLPCDGRHPSVSAGAWASNLGQAGRDVHHYLGLMRGSAAGNKPLWRSREITHALKKAPGGAAQPWWRWCSWRARRTGRRSRLYRT
ncbi:MAG: DnaB-like helicase N-terminal domain-containing protein [Ruthenibacterium lactatiformans]